LHNQKKHTQNTHSVYIFIVLADSLIVHLLTAYKNVWNVGPWWAWLGDTFSISW